MIRTSAARSVRGAGVSRSAARGRVLSFAFLVLNASGAVIAKGEGYTPTILMAVHSLTDTAIAPDGKEVLYVVTDADLSGNRYVPQIWRIATAGGSAQQLTHMGADSPHWSPDGKWVAFLVAGKSGVQLWKMRPDGSGARALLPSLGDVRAFEWSPDGKAIAMLEADAHNTPHGSGGGQPVSHVADENSVSVNLQIIDSDTGAIRQLTRGKGVIADFSWSPNGQEIAFAHRPTERTVDDYNTDIAAVRLSDGTVRNIVVRPGRDDNPKWSPDGSHIAFTSTGGSLAEYASVDLYVVPAAGGTPRDVTPGFGERLYGFYGWSPDASSLYFRARRGVTMQLFRAAPGTAEVNEVTSGNFVYDGFSFSQGRHPQMALLRTDATTPKRLLVSELRRFAPHEILDINPGAQALRIGPTSIIHWRGRDGTAIEGLLALPASPAPGVRAPLLVMIHGGPSGAFTTGFVTQLSAIGVAVGIDACPAQLFTERGYAVLMPNIRGSGGYGEEFRKADVKDWGGEDFQDVLAGIDYLKSNGAIDVEQVGIVGWSYGGFMSAWAIANSDRFKAAVIGAGPTDMWSWYGTTDQPDQAEAYFGGPPWTNPSLYTERSTLRKADHIHTPTLILHGESDEAVPLNQAQQLYRALKRHDVPVEFIAYPRSGHDPTEPLQNLDVWQRSLNWMEHWLPTRE